MPIDIRSASDILPYWQNIKTCSDINELGEITKGKEFYATKNH
jgi:hypothetical protein